MQIYYWCPYLTNIATINAVKRSAISVKKYSKKNPEVSIINSSGEWLFFKNNDFGIKIQSTLKDINLYKYLPKEGFVFSRLSFSIIFILNFFPLIFKIKKNKPNFLIIHLLTFLPIVLSPILSKKTKIILRISGYPELTPFRKLLWKFFSKYLYIVTTPTKLTRDYLIKNKIFDKEKIKILKDPIIVVKEINKKKKENIDLKNFYLSVGRLTKQKNFMFLCEAFKRLIKENDDLKLVIAGNGEDEAKIRNFINKNNLQDNIILPGYIDNIYPYFYNSKGFILTSLWEDPGFVLVEAFFCRKLILSSNSWPGPIELIRDFKNGFVFENENLDSFLKKFKHFNNHENIEQITLNGLKSSRKFSLFSHYQNLNKTLSIN